MSWNITYFPSITDKVPYKLDSCLESDQNAVYSKKECLSTGPLINNGSGIESGIMSNSSLLYLLSIPQSPYNYLTLS